MLFIGFVLTKIVIANYKKTKSLKIWFAFNSLKCRNILNYSLVCV